MAALQPQPLTMQDMLASLDPDLLRCFWRMQAARHKMDPTAFLTAYEGLCDTADCIHRAMTVETWAPAADSQSSPVLDAEEPGLPTQETLLRLSAEGLLSVRRSI